VTARIHLDHNACTPVEPRVLERFVAIERECPANAGSLHASGRRARAVLERARSDAAAALGVADDDVFFVSGGTEANNLALLGAGAAELPVLAADVEHPSVLEPAAVRGRLAWRVGADGAALVEAPTAPVGLLCLVHGQNEVGTLQPIERAAALAAELAVPLHVDAAQTLGRVPLHTALAAAATLALSVHKAGGLRGCSVLVARGGGADLRPSLHGGGQERGLRPGTVSPALAAATALAIELAVAEQTARAAAMHEARAAFEGALDVEYARITPENALPNTLMLAFAHVDGRLLLPAFDMAGVEASQGSACSSGSPQPPRILSAMGLDDARARRCVRFSFSHRTRVDDARLAAQRVNTALRDLQRR
jgi:cysteine desulfurase